jgi:hypothetical protein
MLQLQSHANVTNSRCSKYAQQDLWSDFTLRLFLFSPVYCNNKKTNGVSTERAASVLPYFPYCCVLLRAVFSIGSVSRQLSRRLRAVQFSQSARCLGPVSTYSSGSAFRVLLNCLETDPRENTARNNTCCDCWLPWKAVYRSVAWIPICVGVAWSSKFPTCGRFPWEAPTLGLSPVLTLLSQCPDRFVRDGQMSRFWELMQFLKKCHWCFKMKYTLSKSYAM